MFSVNGTRVENQKTSRTLHTKVLVEIWNLTARGTDVIKWHWGPPTFKMSNLRLSK